MKHLKNLKNSARPKKKRKRLGRGPSSGMGKTSCRGQKGYGSRAGFRARYGKEGGQLSLYLKIPYRGFPRGRFRKENFIFNFSEIDKFYSDGEVVNWKTLQEKGLISEKAKGNLRILARGEITKKVVIEANHFSAAAEAKLKEKNIVYKVI